MCYEVSTIQKQYTELSVYSLIRFLGSISCTRTSTDALHFSYWISKNCAPTRFDAFTSSRNPPKNSSTLTFMLSNNNNNNLIWTLFETDLKMFLNYLWWWNRRYIYIYSLREIIEPDHHRERRNRTEIQNNINSRLFVIKSFISFRFEAAVIATEAIFELLSLIMSDGNYKVRNLLLSSRLFILRQIIRERKVLQTKWSLRWSLQTRSSPPNAYSIKCKMTT